MAFTNATSPAPTTSHSSSIPQIPCIVSIDAAINSSVSDKESSSTSDNADLEHGDTSGIDAGRISAYKSNSRQSITRKPSHDKDDPFGHDGSAGGTQYRTLAWWQASMIMIAETISLGVLSLPSVLATIGIVPGMILIASLGGLATYTGYVIGQFKLRHTHVHSMADAGEVLFAPLGRRWARFGKEFLGAAQTIFLVFSMASHILTWTIMMNTITNSATCTITWSVLALVIFWLLDLPRTLKKMSWMSIASFISILSALMVTMIAVTIERPGNGIDAIETVGFAKAFLSVANIVFAYAGHVAFFGFISEFKDPKEWPKALFLLQISDTTLYMIAAIVIYHYTGAGVASPALGSADTIPKKVAYGIAIPTILVAGVIYGHVATKYIYVRIFRGTPHMSQRSVLSVGTWAAITLILWTIAWIIAESIPNFNDLLGLISALFAGWFTYGIAGIFWLFMFHGHWFDNWRKACLFVCNCGLIVIGAGIMGIGLYASGKSIHSAKGGSGWTCASNAQ